MVFPGLGLFGLIPMHRLDEKGGRRVARKHDLNVTGIVGLLLKGANADTVELERERDALRAAGFWISDELYSRTLSESES